MYSTLNNNNIKACSSVPTVFTAKLAMTQEAAILQSLPPSDYLVPLTLARHSNGELSHINTQPAISSAANPVYVSTLAARQHLTSHWLQQHCTQHHPPQLQQEGLEGYDMQYQQQTARRSDMFAHSYETMMSHDYEDMTNSVHYDPVLMKRNHAYLPSRTISRTLPTHTQLT